MYKLLEVLFEESKKWEGTSKDKYENVNHRAEMSDLNITLIPNYLKEIKSSLYEKSKTGDFVEVCQDMNIVSTLPEYIKPKNVGLMFFSMEPDKFFPYTQIAVIGIAGLVIS